MKIVLFHEKELTVSGAIYQFLNLCNELDKHTAHEVCYVECHNTLIEEEVKNSKINYINVEEFEAQGGYEDAVFITPPNYLFCLLEKISGIKKAKVLLYDWHAYSSIYLRNQFKNQHIDLSAVYSCIDEKNGIAFMDDACRKSCYNILGILLQKRFIPVAKAVLPDSYSVIKRIHKDKICVGYLGRLDADKIYSVINIADNLMKLDTELPIEFHIIGDGDKKELINLERYKEKISFVFTSYLFGNELSSYMKEHIDVLITMGLSLLHGAELGIPCIVAPIGSGYFSSNQFVFLYELTDFILGYSFSEIRYLQYDFKPLESIIYEAIEEKDYHGKKCYEYFLENHQIGYAASKCIEYASKTELTVQDLMDIPAIKEQWDAFCHYHKKTGKNYIAFCGKQEDSFSMLCKWLLLKQHGKNLEDYFIKKDYASIAIYGMGQLGTLLYNEFITSNIEVKYGIDRNPNSTCENLSVVSPENISEQVDAIVVTPIYAFNEIREMLTKKIKTKILSLEDVLNGVKEEC